MVSINGESSDWREGLTVSDVIRQKNYRFPLLIVRINVTLIPRADYDTVLIPDGSTVDIIHLMSGG